MRTRTFPTALLVLFAAVSRTPAGLTSQSDGPVRPVLEFFEKFPGDSSSVLRALRPEPASSALRRHVLATLATEGELRPQTRETEKLARLKSVFVYHERDGVFDTKLHVAKSNSLDVGDLLGVIMAHEIGHLLLPPDSHATGIMAPKLDPFLIQHGGLSFDPRQASMIRARIGSMPRSEQGPCRASGTFGLRPNAAHEGDAAPNCIGKTGKMDRSPGGLGVLATVAWAQGQSLLLADPHDILAIDPAAFIQLLGDVRPSPVTPEAKEMVLKSLPPEGEITVLNASDRGKLSALDPVLRATRRAAVYEVKIIDIPQAAVAIHGRAVILISQSALGVLDADQLRAAVAHEAAHEYVWEEWHRAARSNDWKRLRQIELICDGIATVILHQLGLDSSALITGFERMIRLNLSLGRSLKTWGYPTLDQRREFARKVAAWIAAVDPSAERGTDQRPPPPPLGPGPVST